MNSTISLTTDFGTADEYAGVMKGVILSTAPCAGIVDLTHEIAPQNIRQAAYIIHAAYSYFPKETVHVIVVDPGVGTKRKIVLVRAADQFFLAPDNGVLTLILADQRHDMIAYEITSEHLYRKPVSHTFHGRDIMAPVAATLANGEHPNALGKKIEPHDLVVLDLPQPEVDLSHGTITGAVAYIDHFGNVITNIHRDTLSTLLGTAPSPGALTVSIKSHKIGGPRTSYGSVPKGTPVALFGSRDYLELGINGGNASDILDISIDDEVLVQMAI